MRLNYISLLIFFSFSDCKKQEEPQPQKPSIIYGSMKGIVVLNGMTEGSPVEITSLYWINELFHAHYRNFVNENYENQSVKYRYPLSGGGVKISLINGEFNAETLTDTNGVYQFDNVPVGVSKLTFSKAGYGNYQLSVTLTGGGKISVENFGIIMAKNSSKIFKEEFNQYLDLNLSSNGYFIKKVKSYAPINDFNSYNYFKSGRFSPVHLVLSKDSLVSASNYEVSTPFRSFNPSIIYYEENGIGEIIKSKYLFANIKMYISKSYLEQNFKIGDFFYIKLYGINNNSSKYYNEKGQIVEPSANEDNALLMKFEYTNKNFCKRIFKDGEIESILAKDTLK